MFDIVQVKRSHGYMSGVAMATDSPTGLQDDLHMVKEDGPAQLKLYTEKHLCKTNMRRLLRCVYVHILCTPTFPLCTFHFQ